MKCLVDEHNTIMVTWANHHYLDFVMNWVEHVRGVGVTAYMVRFFRCKAAFKPSPRCDRQPRQL